MKTIYTLAMILIGSAAMAAPASVQAPVSANAIHLAGYYLPDGSYVPTRVCWRRFIGYNVYGNPVWTRVCAWR
jgi:hypothetical protein